MKTFNGFLFSKLHLIGSKSEGPSYFLQQFDYREILVVKKVHPWQEDPVLQKKLGRKVTLDGELTAQGIQYHQIADLHRSLTSSTKAAGLNVQLKPESPEIWLNKMPPSPSPRPFALMLAVTCRPDDDWSGVCPTSQLYDFTVELGGHTIWRWSDGRVFLPVLTPVMMPAGATFTYSETWIIVPENISEEGMYTLRGLYIPSGQEAQAEVRIRFAH